MAQEGVHLGAAHVARVAPAVKPEESPQPLLVGIHGATGVMAHLQLIAIALDQAWGAAGVGHGLESVGGFLRVPQPGPLPIPTRPNLYRLHVQTPSMARVSVTHLRQNLTAWLKRVQAGEAIQVTSHGRVIARIEPEQDPAEEARLWLQGLGSSVTLGDVVAPIANGDADLEGTGDADHL